MSSPIEIARTILARLEAGRTLADEDAAEVALALLDAEEALEQIALRDPEGHAWGCVDIAEAVLARIKGEV